MKKALNLPAVGENHKRQRTKIIEKVALVGETVGLVAELVESTLDDEQVRLYLTKGAAGGGSEKVFLGVFGSEYFEDKDNPPKSGALQEYHEGFRR